MGERRRSRHLLVMAGAGRQQASLKGLRRGRPHHPRQRKNPAAVGYTWAFAALTASPGARDHYDRRRDAGDRHAAAPSATCSAACSAACTTGLANRPALRRSHRPSPPAPGNFRTQLDNLTASDVLTPDEALTRSQAREEGP